MAKKENQWIIVIVLIVVIVIIGKDLGLFIIFSNPPTQYKNVDYSSNYSQIIYSSVITPDGNRMTADNIFKYWSGGNIISFSAGNNPQIVAFWLVNYLGVDKNDLTTCSTDYACLSCGCGGVNGAEAICPTSEDAYNRVQQKLSSIGMGWSSNVGMMCPNSPYSAFLRDVPDNIMNNLSNNLTCIASGKYRGCTNNGNVCGAEQDYNLGGEVSWEGLNGFDCHVTPLGTPSGYEDIRIDGQVTFKIVDRTTCNTPADTNCDGIVSRDELGTYITSWVEGSVTRDNLGLAIVAWVG